MRRTWLSVLVVVALALPTAASAARADDEVRVRGACSPGRAAELRVRADDGTLRVELRLASSRAGEAWSVTLLHERRIVARVRVRTSSSRKLRLRRSLPDLYGRDTVVARATGPAGATCRASASV